MFLFFLHFLPFFGSMIWCIICLKTYFSIFIKRYKFVWPSPLFFNPPISPPPPSLFCRKFEVSHKRFVKSQLFASYNQTFYAKIWHSSLAQLPTSCVSVGGEGEGRRGEGLMRNMSIISCQEDWTRVLTHILQ